MECDDNKENETDFRGGIDDELSAPLGGLQTTPVIALWCAGAAKSKKVRMLASCSLHSKVDPPDCHNAHQRFQISPTTIIGC